MKHFAVGALALSLAGCSTLGAISGNSGDCASAQKQLGLARASLTLTQIALSSAEAFGNPPAIALAQTAVNTINADVTAIQALVSQSCAVAPPPNSLVALPPTITLSKARSLAASDKKLADALKSRGQ